LSVADELVLTGPCAPLRVVAGALCAVESERNTHSERVYGTMKSVAAMEQYGTDKPAWQRSARAAVVCVRAAGNAFYPASYGLFRPALQSLSKKCQYMQVQVAAERRPIKRVAKKCYRSWKGHSRQAGSTGSICCRW